MSDETKDENVGVVPQTPVTIHSQYLKDLSFESPNSPQILVKAESPPEVDINIAVDMKKFETETDEAFYEVILTVKTNATRQGKALFIAEIQYGAYVSIAGIPEEQHHAILFVEVPRMIFPFVRMILANTTQTGGFMPLQLAMVDFRAMYMQRFGQKADSEADQNTDETST